MSWAAWFVGWLWFAPSPPTCVVRVEGMPVSLLRHHVVVVGRERREAARTVEVARWASETRPRRADPHAAQRCRVLHRLSGYRPPRKLLGVEPAPDGHDGVGDGSHVLGPSAWVRIAARGDRPASRTEQCSRSARPSTLSRRHDPRHEKGRPSRRPPGTLLQSRGVHDDATETGTVRTPTTRRTPTANRARLEGPK
jgi:hypothetical protein